MKDPIIVIADQSNMDSDGREEGEIVDDDYEYIISDETDEMNEINVRLRIKELEAKNEELEKIANISTCYSRKYNLLTRKHYDFNSTPNSAFVSFKNVNKSYQVPTDAASITSDEFHPTKRRRRHRQLRSNTKFKSRHRATHQCIQSGLFTKKHYQVKRYMRRKRVSLSVDDYQVPSNKISELNRISLDDSLQNSDIDVCDSRYSRQVQIRDKLRFALARSPTESSLGCLRDRLQKEKDFLLEKDQKVNNFIENNVNNVTAPTEMTEVQENHTDNSMSLEEQELRLIALKSAVMKKHFARKKRNAEIAYSPTDFVVLGGSSDDNMDLMNVDFYDYQNGMNISPSPSPVLAHIDSYSPKCKEIESSAYNKPIDMDIANSDSDEEPSLVTTAPNNVYFECYPDRNPNQLHSTFHLTGVQKCLEEEAPAPPSFYVHPSNIQTNELPVSDRTLDFVNEAEEEEEAALRALLLSKLPRSKNSGRFKLQHQKELCNRKSVGPTESILKEAVRRLTFKSNCANELALTADQKSLNHEPDPSESIGYSLDDNTAGSNSPYFSCLDKSDTIDSNLPEIEKAFIDLNEPVQNECIDTGNDIKKLDDFPPCCPPSKAESIVYDISIPTVITPIATTEQTFTPIQNHGATPFSVTKNKPCTSIKHIEQVKNQNQIDLSNSVGTLKIVKPNKVINKVHNLKRKVVAIQPNCKSVKTSQETNNTESRLLKSTSLQKVTVPKLIITLGGTDTESTDEELSANNVDICHNIDNLYDNTSPISLAIDSQCQVTPVCSNSPNVEYGDNSLSRSPIVVKNNIFEKKLDHFLRNVRNTMEKTSKQNIIAEKPSQKIESITYDTPMAVRHLPPASQLEYRKLIMRMNLLETQKMHKLDEKPDKKNTENSSKFKSTINNKSTFPPTAAEKPKTNLSNVSISDKVSSKSHILQAYEKSYFKTGTVIMSNLEKSLSLVEEIKMAKIFKLRQEEKIKFLHAQMEEAKRKYMHHQQTIVKLTPNIFCTNNVITTLKQRRAKYQKAAKELGKTLQGENYRLNDSLSKDISQKFRKLASDIKHVNSINYSYIKKLDKNASCTKENSKPKDIANVNEDKCADSVILDCPKISNNTNLETKDMKLSNAMSSNAATLINCGSKTSTKDQCNQKVREDWLPEENNSQGKEDTLLKFKTKSSVLSNYVSPLVHLNTDQSQSINPNGIICPYDLVGSCEDAECNFEHLNWKNWKS